MQKLWIFAASFVVLSSSFLHADTPDCGLEGAVAIPAKIQRISISEVVQNPYQLSQSSAAQVITVDGKDFVVAIRLDAIEQLGFQRFMRGLFGFPTNALDEKWLKRVGDNLQQFKQSKLRITGLAKLWNDPKRINEVAMNSFFAVFDESLANGDTLPNDVRVALIALVPELNRKIASPSLPPERETSRESLPKPPSRQLVRDTYGLLYQRPAKSGRLTVVEEMLMDTSHVKHLKKAARYIDKLIDDQSIPLSESAKNPTRVEHVLSFTEFADGSYVFRKVSLFRYRDAKGTDHVVVDGITDITRTEFHTFIADQVSENVEDGQWVKAANNSNKNVTTPGGQKIWYPDVLNTLGIGRATPGTFGIAVGYLRDHNLIHHIEDLKEGERFLFKANFADYKVWTQFQRINGKLVGISSL